MTGSEFQENERNLAKIVRCPRCGMRLNEDGLAVFKSAKPSEEASRSAELMIYEGGACQHSFVE